MVLKSATACENIGKRPDHDTFFASQTVLPAY
jgi:hypothetical protein